MACFRNLEKSQLKAGIRLHGLWLLCALHVSWIHHEHSISLAASTVGGLKPVGKTCPSTVDKDHVCIWYMNTKKRTVSKQVIHSVLPIGLHQPYFSAIRGSRIATLLRMMLQQSDGFSAAEVLEIKVISHPARIFFRCWFCFVTFCGVQGVGRMIETTRSLKENSRLFGDKGYSHPHFPPPQLYTILFELLTTVGEISHIGILFDLICRRPSKSLMKMAAVTSMFVNSQTCCAFRAMLPASMRLQPNLEENRDNGETTFSRENRNKVK